jgi:hypothetical protein
MFGCYRLTPEMKVETMYVATVLFALGDLPSQWDPEAPRPHD